MALCVFAAAGAGGCAGQGACAQALPTVEPSRAAPGETFRLHGGFGGFGAPCNDTPGANEAGPPERDMRVELRQGGRAWHLGEIDARPDHSLDAKLAVPAAAEPGRARVVIHSRHSSTPIEMPLRVLGRGASS